MLEPLILLLLLVPPLLLTLFIGSIDTLLLLKFKVHLSENSFYWTRILISVLSSVIAFLVSFIGMLYMYLPQDENAGEIVPYFFFAAILACALPTFFISFFLYLFF